MEIGIGLPNAIPDVDRDSLVEFGKRVEARGFSSLGTLDSEKQRKASLAYFSLGPDAQAHAERSIGHYYAFLGDYTSQIVESVATTPEMVSGYVQAFEQAGCDELIFFPGSKHLHQVDELADVLGK